MMEDLRELYQEVILEHNRNPRNFREMEDADRVLEGFNPLCGDRYTFYLNLDGDTVREISFTGRPVFAQQAYEWGLVNHVVPADGLMPLAIELAEAMCACVPDVLRQYKPLIDEGYSLPYAEALAWEEQRAIASAGEASAATIAQRREGVMSRGRSEKDAG